ncbi:sensor histidine kinase [Streptomyces alfalfae]|uniref:sensor histidine kinase n=1 Tax=Streptomyces alfalfae TaxID=1642299 RepID=UPI0009A1BE8E|nr:sensor histidine kinase [Streptomyces alfalfae]AYA18509.1 sensor histidine kinase [Streptomyces fradiae]QUI31900.1 sensor histidine kinase [Streptomyces alfalfae]RXX46610.1 sensor histidine kinase [Streptomyces alfalfae]RZN07413.1 sensor histidine kinase [Streptomyces alfalfae]
MPRDHVWGRLRPRGYLVSGAPWRGAGYLAGGALLGAAVLLVGVALTAVGAALTLVLVGIPLLGALAFCGVPLAALERRRLRMVDPAPAPSPHRTPDTPGINAWFRLRVTEQATWRELAYAVLLALVLWPLDLAVLACAVALPALLLIAPAHLAAAGGPAHGVRPAKLWLVESYPAACGTALLGLVALLALAYPLGAYAAARAAFARLLLAPRDTELAASLAEVTRSRARLVDAFEAERRRIERDLHDGAQQRLVALTMGLGLARLDAEPGTPLAERLATAHDEAGRVLTELRELIRGIHPQVLTDYGLATAIEDAADRSPVPVDTAGTELPRLPEAVESAGYFAVREALANVGKHSGADSARVTAVHTGEVLRIDVRDDGRGGADPAHGTGLTGLADRLAVLDGTLTVTSPPGGPTVLSVEIPCRAEA